MVVAESTIVTYRRAGDSFAGCFNAECADAFVRQIMAGRLDLHVMLDKLVSWLFSNGALKTTINHVGAIKTSDEEVEKLLSGLT